MYIVINGGGKVGSALAAKLSKKGHTVAIIEMREDIADKLAQELYGLNVMVILGDGCDARYLEEAGIRRADVFVAATGEDDDNLVSCQLAKIVYEVPRALSRVNSPKNLNIFRKLDIEGISSTDLISRMIEEEAIIGNMHTLKTLSEGNLALIEVELDIEYCPVNGRRVGDVLLPKNVQLIAVVRTGHATVDQKARGDIQIEVITPETVLYCGDTVIAAAHPDRESELARILMGVEEE